VTDDLWNSLQAVNLRIKELENLLAENSTEFHRLELELDKANEKLHMHQDSSALWKEKHEKTYHELRMQRQTTKPGQEKLNQLQEQVQFLKTAEKEASKQLLRGPHESHQALALLQKQNDTLNNELSMSMASWTSQLEKTHTKLAKSASDLKTLHNQASK
jgi:chromosome segregation ATPase